MHVDLHNLTPSVGELNADRSNYRFSLLPGEPPRHGLCPSRVSFNDRQFEPRDLAEGFVARVYFYMHDRYKLPISRQQERLLMTWDRQYPISSSELKRIQGTSNEFVTGERTWIKGYKPRGDGLKGTELKAGNQPVSASSEPVIGNKNSDIYHLPDGVCPSYNRVTERNGDYFPSESAAKMAGYRKAGNCR